MRSAVSTVGAVALLLALLARPAHGVRQGRVSARGMLLLRQLNEVHQPHDVFRTLLGADERAADDLSLFEEQATVVARPDRPAPAEAAAADHVRRRQPTTSPARPGTQPARAQEAARAAPTPTLGFLPLSDPDPSPSAGGRRAELRQVHSTPPLPPCQNASEAEPTGGAEHAASNRSMRLPGSDHAEPAATAVSRAHLVAFYRRVAPEKLPAVDQILAAFRGRERDLLRSLRRKYGASPLGVPSPRNAAPADDGAEAGGRPQRLRGQLLGPGARGAPPEPEEEDDEEEDDEKAVAEEPEQAEEQVEGEDAVGAQQPVHGVRGPREPDRAGNATTRGDLRSSGGALRFTEGQAAPGPGRNSSSARHEATPPQHRGGASARGRGPQPAGGAEGAELFKQQLLAFYKRYNPGKLAALDEIAAAYSGREAELAAQLRAKYGASPHDAWTSRQARLRREQPSAELAAAIRGGGALWRSTLHRFYATHAPQKLDRLGDVLQLYRGKEALLLRRLRLHYNVTEAELEGRGDGAVASRAATDETPSGSPPRPRPAAAVAGPSQSSERAAAATQAAGGRPPPGAAVVDAAWPASDDDDDDDDGKAHEDAFAEGRRQEERAWQEHERRRAAGVDGDVPSDADGGSVLLERKAAAAVHGTHKRLMQFFAVHDPDRAQVSRVANMLRLFSGDEALLWQSLQAKYGRAAVSVFQPKQQELTLLEQSGGSMRLLRSQGEAATRRGGLLPAAGSVAQQLEAFYRVHDPAKVPHVPYIVELYDGDPAGLWRAVREKYGSDALSRSGAVEI